MKLPEWANKLIVIGVLVGLIVCAYYWFIAPIAVDISEQMSRPVMPDEVDLRPYAPYIQPLFGFLVLLGAALGALAIWVGKLKVFT
jgi:hypothetical protein